MRPLRLTGGLLLVAYVGVVTFGLLTPDSGTPAGLIDDFADVGRAVGVPDAWLTPTRAEFIANVAVAAPVTCAATWLWPSRPWTAWTTYGFLVSVAVEAVQAVLLTGRSATFSDVVANTAGACAGALVGWVVLQVVRAAGAARSTGAARG